MNRAPILICCSIVALVAAACSSPFPGSGSDTHGDDKQRLFPTLRATLATDGRGERGVKRARFTGGIEAAATGTAGHFDLTRGVGRTEYEVFHGSLTYRFGLTAPRVEVQGLVGPVLERLEMSGNPSTDAAENLFGLLVGVEVRVHATDWMSPYFRGTASILEGGSYSFHREAGLAIRVADQADLLLAYRRWDAEYVSAAPLGFDANLDWEGLVVGLAFRF